MGTIADYINDLSFDYDGFDAVIRSILGAKFRVLRTSGQFTKEIKFLPLDAQNLSKTQTPAITMQVTYTPFEPAMDSFQVNNQTQVIMQFDVYTSGSKARIENIKIRDAIMAELIRIQSVEGYRLLGMNIDDNTEAMTKITDVTRGVVRISCVVDNKNKVIMKRRY